MLLVHRPLTVLEEVHIIVLFVIVVVDLHGVTNACTRVVFVVVVRAAVIRANVDSLFFDVLLIVGARIR